MNKFVALILIVLVLANGFSAVAQPGKPNGTTKPIEQTIPLEIIDDANSFSDKGLPLAYIIGTRPSDKLGVELAQKISNYDEKSLSILVATLQKAGFYIIDENQKILYKPTFENGMGLAFYDFEVVGMYKLSRGGVVSTVDKMAGAMGKDLPGSNIGALMLQDLRNAANSDDLIKRFWARLIIELGKQFPQPVDLMTATPETAQLSVIQAALWERRLVGDLIAFVSKQSAMFQPSRQNLFSPESNEVNFVNASFSKTPIVPEPCDFSEVETVQVDAGATATTTIHGKTLEGIIEKTVGNPTTGSMGKLEKFGKGLGYVNLALSWAKLVAALTQIKGEIKVQDPMPLIRTRSNRTPGEKRLLTAKFEIKVNDLRKLNCVRMAINATTGLDFSMPSSGPLGEKPVSWELGGEVSFKGQNSSRTGAFDQVVYLLPLEGNNRDQHKQETSKNGTAEIYLEGAKQKEDLTDQKVVPLPKLATVRADIALKNMKDTKQEVTDVGSMALGVVTGGGYVGILSALPELGFRAKIPVVAIKVPIRDWIPCSEDWGGVITITREGKWGPTTSVSELSESSRTVTHLEEAVYTLRPRTSQEIAAGTGLKQALGVFHGKYTDITDINSSGNPCCGKTEGKFDTKYKKGWEEEFFDSQDDFVDIKYKGNSSNEKDFRLGFSVGSGPFESNARDFLEIVKTNCSLEYDNSKSTDRTVRRNFSFSLDEGRHGGRLNNSAGEILSGFKVQAQPDGSSVTWNWNLARCKD